MNNVLELPVNTKGRDILVSDIHGEFHLLKKALSAILFNKSKDRLIIAGDLVDRGENSKIALEWAEKDYCFCAMGNHDAQHIFHDKHNLFVESLVCLPVDPWYVDLEDEYENYFDRLGKALYPAIEIQTSQGIVGVIHAELPECETWLSAKEKLNNKDYNFLRKCIWGRDFAKMAQRGGFTEQEINNCHVEDVKWLVHGHTPAKKLDYYPYSLANRVFIDTCSYKAEKYETAGITLFDAENPLIPIYTTANRELVLANAKII